MPNLPIKITQISKDFNIKSKDVLDTFKDLGLDKKSGGSADVDEFELFFSKITASRQIKDIDAYRDGRTKITSDNKKDEAKPEPKVTPAPQREVAEKAPVETEEPKQRIEAPVSKGSIGVKVTNQTEEEKDIFDTGEKGTKTKWWKKFQDKVTNMGNSFVGNDEDNDF